MKSADGSKRFERDIKNGKLEQLLLKTLLFTTLEMQNHIRSFVGSDNRYYCNQLCLDNTNGETLATHKLKNLNLNASEKNLIDIWNNILDGSKKTSNYNPDYNYGVYQIFVELNTFQMDEKTGKKFYDYPTLNGNLLALKAKIKEYYNTEITPYLFKYEFLK